MKWFLVVEKVENDALSDIRCPVCENLCLRMLIALAASHLASLTPDLDPRRLERMATMDCLTGLLDQHAFNIMRAQSLADVRRVRQPSSAILFDIGIFECRHHRVARRGFAAEAGRACRAGAVAAKHAGRELREDGAKGRLPPCTIARCVAAGVRYPAATLRRLR